MTRVMVAYGPATRNPSGHEAAKQQGDLDSWAAAHGAEVLVWRREGRSTLTNPIELRTRLHQALFCIRADFADDLWMPSWPPAWGPWDHALICASLGSRSGQLIINGTVQTPAETDLFARARRWMNLLDKVDPRKVRSEGADDPADIGAYLGAQEAARLARKLKDDFGVTENSIATWLERYDYESPAGTPYTSGGVNHLLKGSVQAADVDIERASIHDAAGRPNTTLPRIAVATFGPDADRLLARAQRWGSGLQVPIGTVLPVTAQGQSSDPAIDLSIRTDLVNLLTICPVLTAVYVTSREALVEDPDDRTFILTLLEHHGVPVIVDDEPLSAAGPGQEAAPEITRANSAIRLHQQLRAHDRGTVQDPGLSLARARELAEMRRDQHLQRTLEVIARELNEEGIPTRRGNGQWWAASVKALLERGPR